MRRVCPKNVESGLPPESCIEPRVELVASITLVFDPSAFSENANKVTKLVKLNGNDWSVRSLFGMGITSKCPMASESRVYVATSPDIETVLRLDPKSTKPLIDYKDDKVRVFELFIPMAVLSNQSIRLNRMNEIISLNSGACVRCGRNALQ